MRVVALLCVRYGIAPERVIGHHEAGSGTTRPGRNVDLDDFRRRVASET